VPVSVVVMIVTMILVFVEVPIVTAVSFVPFVIVFEATVWTVPIAGVEVAAFMTGSNPSSAAVRRPSPVTFMPAVVPGDGIPVSADPHEIGCGLCGHNGNDARGGRSADHNTDRYLCFCGNACQQKRRKSGSF